MPPLRNTNLAENHREFDESPAHSYNALIEAMSSNPVTRVAFMSYFQDDGKTVDFIQVSPIDDNLKGYGDFTLSVSEFQAIQKEFPKVNFIAKKGLEAEYVKQFRENGVFFPLTSLPEQVRLGKKVVALEETIRKCKKELSDIAAEFDAGMR
jgi:hypothetical protein